MTRTIKFRAWNKADKTMGEPFSLEQAIRIRPAVDPTIDCVYMQFTGLTDKNGKEIFEGDLVRINNLKENWKHGEPDFEWKVLAIEYNQYTWAFNNSVLYFPLSTYRDRAGEFYDYDIELIGNIYENSDLLTPKK